MRCEIIAIGTELLLGQIDDTNSSWIGEQLAQIGVDSYYQTKVGDNRQRIVETIRLALTRNEAVILCGGLGPTQDDITRDAIAEVMGVALRRDTAIAERIAEMFRSRDRHMPDNNLRQADIPVGSRTMAQMPGTAPGLICPLGDQVIFALPGVPSEMREMFLGSVLPELINRAGSLGAAAIQSRTLRTWGQSESGLAEMLAERIATLDKAGNPTLAFLASGIEGLKVRITAKADSIEAAHQHLDDEQRRLQQILGNLVFSNDDEAMEKVVIDDLRQRGLTLGVAESLTGGLVGARLTAVPGASDVFRGAVVAYASDVKFDLLDVPPGPVVSAVTAQAMALGVARVLQTDIGLATTGVAGPSEQEGQAVGTVYIGLAVNGSADAKLLRLPGQRNTIRELTVISLLNWLRLRCLDLDVA